MNGNENVEKFLASMDELISCKYLVAEYKIQKALQDLANCDDACKLIGECLEQFNREREFSKTFIHDGQGDFICSMPEEEYKVIALVFCTLIDIDNKKIDFTDFVKRFFGRDENAFKSFVATMIIPFRNLIAEAFGFPKKNAEGEEIKENSADKEQTEENEEYEGNEELAYDDDEEESEDLFDEAQKLAVQIMSELQFISQNSETEKVDKVCRAIVKTTDLRDEEVTSSLANSLRFYKVKQLKLLMKELYDLFD